MLFILNLYYQNDWICSEQERTSPDQLVVGRMPDAEWITALRDYWIDDYFGLKNRRFHIKDKDAEPLPVYADSKDRLPKLIWDDNPDAVDCYNKAWEIGFGNLRTPQVGDGMVSNYIDTAFNGFLFMWDSSFITMFGKYGLNVFNFQKTLDNLYARQHMDGFICREICEKIKGDQFHRFDPVSTGPNIMPWAEWESFQVTGDIQRIKAVFPPLLAYHLWLKKYRTWPDGTYWTSGWGCGMDNQPRVRSGYSAEFHHGWQVWMDACIQQILSDKILISMAGLIGREKDVEILRNEEVFLTKTVNEKLWDDKTAFYYDLWDNGKKSMVKSIGAYWALVAGIVPPQKAEAFVAHLQNNNEFNRIHRIPTLSADNPEYQTVGGYWKGGVWSPTNYMVLKGLEQYGYNDLAREIALNHVNNVVEVFRNTKTLWENYAPEAVKQGNPAKRDFVGWTGLSPIAITMEQVFGIHSNTKERKITWRIRENGRHGVLRYPMGADCVDLICPEHQPGEKPRIQIRSDSPVMLEIQWPDGTEEKLSVGAIQK